MKTFRIIFLALISLFIANVAISQVVDGITYQAVALDQNGKEIPGMDIYGNILQENAIAIRFSIIEGSLDGTMVYQEEHNTNTDINGLFSLVIGHGEVTGISPNAGILDVAWGSDKHFLKVEIDMEGSGSYKVMGIQQLMAVPYAFYALNADYNSLDNLPVIPSSTSQLNNDSGFITNPDDADSDPINELQILSISNDTVYLSNGGFIELPEGFSGDYNDLINTPTFPTNLSELNNDSGFITNPDDADADPTNELQILSISNDTLYLSDGGYVELPEGFSGDYNDLSNLPDLTDFITEEVQVLTISNDTIYLSGGSYVVIPEAVITNIDWSQITNLPDNITNLISNDFSGDYYDLTNAPTNVSAFTNDAGYITNPNDADSDPTNELQIISISNDTVYLSDGGYVKLPEGFSGSWNDLSDVPTNLTTIINNNFEGDYSDLTNVPTNVSAFTNDAGYITSPNDADFDPTNELQMLSISNDTIYLTNGGFVKLPESTQSSSNHGMQIITTVGTTQFNVPEGVNSIKVKMVGGGGGGAGLDVSNFGGSGGGGPYFEGIVSVNPNEKLFIIVGSGGLRGAGTNGSQGGSSFVKDSLLNTLLTLNGGNGGFSNGASGAGGSGLIINNTRVVGIINSGESGFSGGTKDNQLGGGVFSPFSNSVLMHSDHSLPIGIRNVFVVNNTVYGQGGNGYIYLLNPPNSYFPGSGYSGCCIIEW